MAKAKRTVEWDGRIYKVRKSSSLIPDLASMDRIFALSWLIKHTYAKGVQRSPNALAGFGGAISVST